MSLRRLKRPMAATDANNCSPTWPPAEYALPDDLAAIEAGRQQQRELLPPDDSREARLRRLTGTTRLNRPRRCPVVAFAAARSIQTTPEATGQQKRS